jgi:hypothetical protein
MKARCNTSGASTFDQIQRMQAFMLKATPRSKKRGVRGAYGKIAAIERCCSADQNHP